MAVVNSAFGELGDEGCHGKLDVQLHHVGDGMELNVDDLVTKGHEADEHQLHDRQHQIPLFHLRIK